MTNPFASIAGRPADESQEKQAVRRPHSESEPYPGFSRGLPYEPKTEQELYWVPSPSSPPKKDGLDNANCGVGLHLVHARLMCLTRATTNIARFLALNRHKLRFMYDRSLTETTYDSRSFFLDQVWDADVGTLVVEEVQEGSTASRSGLINVDDVVCEVDGINVTGQPLDVVESLMRGKSVFSALIDNPVGLFQKRATRANNMI